MYRPAHDTNQDEPPLVPEKPKKYQTNRKKGTKHKIPSNNSRVIEVKPPSITITAKKSPARKKILPSDLEKPHPALPYEHPKIKWYKRPVVVYFISFIQIIVFIAELIKMGVLTGSPIQTKPSFNPMIGPSSYLLINMGARFTPCMHYIEGLTSGSGSTNLLFPCPNSTTDATNVCSLAELCGGLIDFTSDHQFIPNQWWRFITPIFLHSGLVHIGFNLLLQIKLGGTVECQIGHLRFSFIYFASGIAGFILGGNFMPNGIASTGSSGCLFGVIALDLLDLLFNWRDYVAPKKVLVIHIVEIVISFAIGLLPGLDNFCHIGGFAMGLILGTALLKDPGFVTRRCQVKQNETEHDDDDELTPIPPPLVPTTSMTTLIANPGSLKPSNKKQAFKDKLTKVYKNKPLIWFIWLALRLAAISLAIVYFVLLINQFGNEDTRPKCTWCKYLSCIPVKDWCNIGNISTTETTSNTGFVILILWHILMRP
jgi:membrane associated rhomboid family serine protease